jgi:hypothetical protein
MGAKNKFGFAHILLIIAVIMAIVDIVLIQKIKNSLDGYSVLFGFEEPLVYVCAASVCVSIIFFTYFYYPVKVDC